MMGFLHKAQRRRVGLILLPIIFLTIFSAASGAPAYDDTLRNGFGEFIYTGYKPLADKPITVHYYLPGHLPEDAPIMIFMHGNSRAAVSCRNSMAKYAEKDKFLLFVPEFSLQSFPGSQDYHQGGVFEKNGHLKPEADWTFSVIEPLFDYIKKLTGRKNKGYILYGFSAGAQFVHRYSWFCPDNRAVKTISASAGSYTMPDYESQYPYGLKETKVPKSNLIKAFSKDITIMVGSADTVLSSAAFPKSPQANKQGRDRVERTRNFCNYSGAHARSGLAPEGSLG